MFKLNPGINECTNFEYHSDVQYLSSSDYKLILTNPAEFYRKKFLQISEPQEDKDHFSLGSYVHSRILEPHVTDSEFVVYPGLIKRGKEFEAFKAQNPNRTILNKGQYEKAVRLIKGYKALPEAMALISAKGFSEQTICVELNGIKTKVRPDRLSIEQKFIVDVKTSGHDVDLDSFKQTVDHWDYILSAVVYLQAAELYYGVKLDFYWLALSTKSGKCELFKLSEASRKKGEMKLLAAQKKYKQCLESGIWTIDSQPAIIKNTNSIYEVLEI